MGYKFKAWALDGSLNSYLDFDVWNGNGTQESTAVLSEATRGDRVDTVVEDGYNALRVRRYAGDPIAGNGKRTELVPNEYSHIYDWVGEAEAGADANDAIRQYRCCVKIPTSFPIEVIDGTSGSWFLPMQLHQVPDTSPADTAGLNPTLSLQLRKNTDRYPIGRWRWAIVRNTDPTATVTAYNEALHANEVCSWPFVAGQWEDVHIVCAPWSYSSAGNMTVYRNRRPVFVEAGAGNCPNNAPSRGGGGMYCKMGLYTYFDHDFEVYHRGIIIGDHESTFADMYPELDNAVPLERVLPSLACPY